MTLTQENVRVIKYGVSRERCPECIATQNLREIVIIRHSLGRIRTYHSPKKGHACEDAFGIALTEQNGKI